MYIWGMIFSGGKEIASAKVLRQSSKEASVARAEGAWGESCRSCGQRGKRGTCHRGSYSHCEDFGFYGV